MAGVKYERGYRISEFFIVPKMGKYYSFLIDIIPSVRYTILESEV